MGRRSVVLDEDLLVQCRKATGIEGHGALIDHALRELLRHERQKEIL
ncbi:MAG: type II toxin-antitoxin system VapB family antitoxin, partial [Planctomycetes bacterium]|nr:type II toxin-antitoxin system VapB family antitoxin [Planctomycetota bacterium]